MEQKPILNYATGRKPARTLRECIGDWLLLAYLIGLACCVGFMAILRFIG